jgi:hypothetical protein
MLGSVDTPPHPLHMSALAAALAAFTPQAPSNLPLKSSAVVDDDDDGDAFATVSSQGM